MIRQYTQVQTTHVEPVATVNRSREQQLEHHVATLSEQLDRTQRTVRRLESDLAQMRAALNNSK